MANELDNPSFGTIGSIIGALAGGMFGGPGGAAVGSMAGKQLGNVGNQMMAGGTGALPQRNMQSRSMPQQTPIDQLLQMLGGKAGKVGDLLRKPDNEWPKGDYETTPVTAPDVTRSPEVWS